MRPGAAVAGRRRRPRAGCRRRRGLARGRQAGAQPSTVSASRWQGRIALDIGASTGGFTQVLLARGATRVYAVDVGHGQLAPRLASDPRVISLERCDARRLDRALVPEPVGAIVADVSFISLTKALPVPLALAGPGAWLVALIKPQFEAGRAAVGKGGVVRDPAARQQAVRPCAAGWRARQAGALSMSCLRPSPAAPATRSSCWGPSVTTEPQEVEIVGLGAQGDGIAKTSARDIHVPFALPGERVASGRRWAARNAARSSRKGRPRLPAFRHLRRLRRPAHARRALRRVETQHRRAGLPPPRHRGPGRRSPARAARQPATHHRLCPPRPQ